MASNHTSRTGLRAVPTDIVQFLLRGQTFRLVTHIRGDADSASIFPLASALRQLGKQVACFHDLPSHMTWLYPSVPNDAIPVDALVVAVDTGNYSRLALSGEERDKIQTLLRQFEREDQITREQWESVCKIDAVIDHHMSNAGYGALNWIDPASSSSAELVTSLLVALEEETGQSLMDADIAWRLYTGLASDTQWFSRPVPPSAYATAALLEERFEIDKVRIAESLRAQSEGYFRLGEVLRRTFRMDQSVASAYIDSASIRQHGVSSEEAATLIEDLERLPAQISLLFVETKPGEIRVRLRGKDVPVLGLAKQFGGGGHTYRAGASVSSSAEMDELFHAAIRWLSSEHE